jgi:hypothetical protein
LNDFINSMDNPLIITIKITPTNIFKNIFHFEYFVLKAILFIRRDPCSRYL